MMSKRSTQILAVAALIWTPVVSICVQKKPLRMEHYINPGTGSSMVSTLFIGSESAVLIDIPGTLPAAASLADWVRNTTDKPLAAVFVSHHHVDHYLGANALLSEFPEAAFYTSRKSAEMIAFEVDEQTARWRILQGPGNIPDDPIVPVAYNETFFALSGHEEEPIILLSNMVIDTVYGTMYWIPSKKTVIAGDAVYDRTVHPFMANSITKALAEAWLDTLDFIIGLAPESIIPGHASSLAFDVSADIKHTKQYISVFQSEILDKNPEFYIRQQIIDLFESRFSHPNRDAATLSRAALNLTAEKYSSDGAPLPDIIDLTGFNDSRALKVWEIRA